MWTILFAIIFVIAIGLNLAALSENEHDPNPPSRR